MSTVSHWGSLISLSSRHICVWLLLAGLFSAAGCKTSNETASKATFELTTDPSPPVLGLSKITVKLSDADKKAVAGATVKVEGNMNHAGMRPSLADLSESSPGVYEGKLDFTMAGAWFILITATTKDHGELTHKVDIPEVRRH